MQKNVLFFVVLVAGILLTACTQEQQNTAKTLNDLKKQNQQIPTAGTVDKSDFINAQSLISSLSKQDLNKEEKSSLIQMREEEKLAHDVYLSLYNKWNLPVFANIAKSEQTHTNAIKELIDRYELENPVKSKEVGVFTSQTLQQLYNDLVSKGNRSLLDALKIGATVEDLDIKDLEEFLKITDNEDIKIVYQNLMKGSRNHLRSFTRLIKNNGGIYSPQYISDEEYQQIISGEMERNIIGANNSHTPMHKNFQNSNEQGMGNMQEHRPGQNQGQ